MMPSVILVPRNPEESGCTYRTRRANKLLVLTMMPDAAPIAKKRRLAGACDLCRQKKVRCDSAKMPGGICSNCLELRIDCKSNGRIRPSLTYYGTDEDHVSIFKDNRETRNLVATILSTKTPYIPPTGYQRTRATIVDLAQYIEVLEREIIQLSESTKRNYTIDDKSNTNFKLEQPTLKDQIVLSDQLKSLALTQAQTRFYGHSSNLMLLKAVIDVRKQYSGVAEMPDQPKRLEYWRTHPWQLAPEMAKPPLIFPERDLLYALVDLYFFNINLFVPIFHRPTFDRLLAQDTHLNDRQFGMVLLTVCAVASRYSPDTRVSEDNVESQDLTLSLGWKWFSQVSPYIVRTSLLRSTTIYELQLYCVAMLYIQGSSTPDSAWTYLGCAVRAIQEIGLHRRDVIETRRTPQSELWKRVFWVIISMDIVLSASVGRPRATNSDDYDQDLPAECDDEYWEHFDPNQAFKQPPGKPSKLSFWILRIKGLHILAWAQRTIYPVAPSKSWANSSAQWDNKVVSRIDAALNEWLKSVPEHLKWHPHRQDTMFFDQSAILYTNYYYTQIIIHRPFIPMPGQQPPVDTGFPSLAICANAARSSCRIMEVQSQRSFLPLPTIVIPVITSALVLLLNLWGGRDIGVPSNAAHEYALVHKCINVLRIYESRWQVAGRFWYDISFLNPSS
ncbi:fungal-specific transcription factor domain-containing protein [Mycena floridula]|nr:fungal-specific transcription factor domain-containing protein [Mycena floridula]